MGTFNIVQVKPATTEEERLLRATAIWHAIMDEAYTIWRRNQLLPQQVKLALDGTDLTRAGNELRAGAMSVAPDVTDSHTQGVTW